MSEATPVWFIGLPMLLLLGILALFGITWMFHHHHWKPVVGGFLFLLGVAALLMFGWAIPRHAAVQEAFAPRSVDQYPDDDSRGVGTAPAPPLARAYQDSSAPGRLEVRADTARSPQSTDSTSATSQAERTESKPSSDAAAPAVAPSGGRSDGEEKDGSEARPAWVDWPSGLRQVGKGYQASVASGWYATKAECDRAVIPRIKELADEFVAENVPEAVENDLSLDRSYVWSKLVQAKHWETVDKTFGSEMHPMKQLHALLVFDSQIGRDLTEQARQALVGARLMNAAVITGCSLALLGGVYMLLKRGATPRTPTAEQVAS